nr:GNAT family N-acetyltransferase [uncultured Cedecea sp.]
MSSVHEIRAELRYLVRELGLLSKDCFHSGLSLTQAHILTYLSTNGLTSFNELSLQLNMDKASLSRILTTLITCNYVETIPVNGDKRRKYFQLTPEGTDQLIRAEKAADSELNFINEEMKKDEITTVTEGLRMLRKVAFLRNVRHESTRIQIECLRINRYADVQQLLLHIFTEEQNIPEELIPISENYQSKWWVARAGEYLLGAVACWQENEQYHWGRFCVDPAYRGLGIGKKLALKSLQDMFLECSEVIIDARDITVNLIRQFGGEVTGEARNFYGMAVTPMRLEKKRFESLSATARKKLLPMSG